MGQTNSRQNNNYDEIKAEKICIGDTCLSRDLLREILIATNNSIQLSSNTPYVKNEKNEGSCNKGYGGKIIYSTDGKGLSGCNKCKPGTYKSLVSNDDCIKCQKGYYCPDYGGNIQQKCGDDLDSEEGESVCLKKTEQSDVISTPSLPVISRPVIDNSTPSLPVRIPLIGI